MRKILCCLTLVLLSSWQNVYAEDDPVLDKIVHQSVSDYMSQQQVPGLAIGIYYRNSDHYYNFGTANKETMQPVTQNTIFELASVSKIFTATLLALCVQQGTCKLDDSVTKYLPALATTNGLPIDKVSLVDLATHTASFPRDVTGFGVERIQSPAARGELMTQLRQWQPDYPIGTYYVYSNISFGLLGEAMSNAFHKSYSDAVTNLIFTPLKMHGSYENVPSSENFRYAQGYWADGTLAPHYGPANWPGGGGLRSTAADLLNFLKANLGVNNPAMPALLSAAIQLSHKQYFQVNPNFSLGLGWQRNTTNNVLMFNKNGMNSGFSSYIAFYPQQKIAIVVLANQRKAMPGILAKNIMSKLLAQGMDVS